MRSDFPLKEKYGFHDLVQIMRVLRGPGGCPWDAQQTHASIRKNFIEETYEAIEAIDAADPVLLQEELGDVLLQVIYHAAMEEEQGSFSIDDVCDGVCKKLVRKSFLTGRRSNSGKRGRRRRRKPWRVCRRFFRL